MAKVVGVAAPTVQAIWKAYGLSPHRWRRFKLSNDPAFAEKLTEIVGVPARQRQFLLEPDVYGYRLSDRKWSAGASVPSCFSSAKAFFERPFWPSENDYGDA